MSCSAVEKCRLCGNPELVAVCDLGVMALTGIFPKTSREEVPQGPLQLVKCHGPAGDVCGLVQLRHDFDPRMLFGQSYGYRSGLNAAMRAHLNDTARQIKTMVPLYPGDVVIDIGSNDGTLLRAFSGEGLTLLGIDPTAEKFARYYPQDAAGVAELFSSDLVRRELGGRKAKVVAGMAVFYDMADPLGFLRQVHDILTDDGICVLEQSYLPTMLAHHAYDTICHEHAAYYGARQMQWLADHAGLKVIHSALNGINGGSFVVVLASRGKADSAFDQLVADEERAGLDTLAPYHVFRENVLRHRDGLRARIMALCDQGRTVAGYGASTKGNVLLQFCELTASQVLYMAEINEDKWGRFCPGTRIPIIPEDEARRRGPDVFLVLPWHWKEGFLVKENRYLCAGGAMLFPLPVMDMVCGG